MFFNFFVCFVKKKKVIVYIIRPTRKFLLMKIKNQGLKTRKNLQKATVLKNVLQKKS